MEEKLNSQVTILKDGPIIIENAKIVLSNDTIIEPKKTFLCRCGGSKNKPYCDGTHKKINFTE